MEEILALALQQVVAALRVFNSLKFTVVGGGNKSGGDPGYVPSFLSSSKGKHVYGLSYMQSFLTYSLFFFTPSATYPHDFLATIIFLLKQTTVTFGLLSAPVYRPHPLIFFKCQLYSQISCTGL